MPEPSMPTADTASDEHPHEPEIDRQLDDEGRCLICMMLVDHGEEVRALAAKNADLAKDRDAWKDHKVSDTEAQAISACVKALAPFQTSQYGNHADRQASVRRVLDFLAHRFGVRDQVSEILELQQAIARLGEDMRRPVEPAWQPPQFYGNQPLTTSMGYR